MKQEELLECDAAMLESFTDVQLIAWYEPMFNVTRPERVERKVVKQAPLVLKVSSSDADKLKSLGIDVGSLMYGNKKKR